MLLHLGSPGHLAKATVTTQHHQDKTFLLVVKLNIPHSAPLQANLVYESQKLLQILAPCISRPLCSFSTRLPVCMLVLCSRSLGLRLHVGCRAHLGLTNSCLHIALLFVQVSFAGLLCPLCVLLPSIFCSCPDPKTSCACLVNN